MMVNNQVSLKPFNTFGIDVEAKYFVKFRSINELMDVLDLQIVHTEERLVLGGGSNLLLTKDFEGVILKNEIKGIIKLKENDEFVWVKANAGEEWHDFVLYCIEKNWGGIENLSLIPGNVGAAPMQNIGAYGVEIKDVFEELEAVHIETKTIHKFSKKKCQFGYRESIFKKAFKNQYIITGIVLKLTKNPIINTSYGAIENELKEMQIENPTIKDVSDAIIKIRQSKLPNPKEIGNSGSFFKNPVVTNKKLNEIKKKYPEVVHYPVNEKEVKIAAGWLIEKAGWKGKTIGNYGVHKNQALVLVNYGGANGNDIFELSNEIIQDIKKKFGIELEREVNIL